MPRQPDSLFYEEQPLRQSRLVILTAIPPVSMLLLAIWQVGFGHTWGKNPMSNPGIIGWTIFLWLVYLRLITITLVTELRPGELRVAMRGIWRSTRVSLSQITSAKAVTFDPTRDWGGYGVRIRRRGRAYLASGTQGVEIQMSTGSALVIGSRHAVELAAAILRAR